MDLTGNNQCNKWKDERIMDKNTAVLLFTNTVTVELGLWRVKYETVQPPIYIAKRGYLQTYIAINYYLRLREL